MTKLSWLVLRTSFTLPKINLKMVFTVLKCTAIDFIQSINKLLVENRAFAMQRSFQELNVYAAPGQIART